MNKDKWNNFVSTYDSIDDLIVRAQDAYNDILLKAGVSEYADHTLWNYGTIIEVTQEYVLIEWEVHWRYGGYDSGSYTIPVEAILDDTWEETS